MKEYFMQMTEAENVNGCIFNKKIDLFDFLNLDKLCDEMKMLYTKERD